MVSHSPQLVDTTWAASSVDDRVPHVVHALARIWSFVGHDRSTGRLGGNLFDVEIGLDLAVGVEMKEPPSTGTVVTELARPKQFR